jgi:hypothetical protein
VAAVGSVEHKVVGIWAAFAVKNEFLRVSRRPFEITGVVIKEPGHQLLDSDQMRSAMASPLGRAGGVVGIFLPELTRGYARLLYHATGMSSSVHLEGASLFLRPFFALFIVLFSLFAAGPLTLRTRLLAFGLALWCAVTFAIDCALAWTILGEALPPCLVSGGSSPPSRESS